MFCVGFRIGCKLYCVTLIGEGKPVQLHEYRLVATTATTTKQNNNNSNSLMRRVAFSSCASFCAGGISCPLVSATHSGADQHSLLCSRSTSLQSYSCGTDRCDATATTLLSNTRGFATTSVSHHYAAAAFGAPTRVLLMRKFKGRKGPRTREAKEGDWLCQCGETNYKSKRECYKCGAPAPPLPPGVRRPSLPGEDPNDWACPCGQMNFRGSVNCHKCQQPKPVAPPPPGQEVTMWTCSKCKNINRNTRKNCFKCFALAPAGVVPPIRPNAQQQQQPGMGQQQPQSPLGGMFAGMGGAGGGGGGGGYPQQ